MSTQEITFVVGQDKYQEVCQTVWQMGGYVRARGKEISVIAERDIFYQIHDAVQGIINPQEEEIDNTVEKQTLTAEDVGVLKLGPDGPVIE